MSFLQSLDPSAPIEVLLPALLPDTANLRLEHVRIDPDQLLLTLVATQSEAACPVCDQPSRRIQSRYTRTLADLPWATTGVQLQLHVRRFFCPNPACVRKIFTERLPAVVLAYARRTNRLRDQLLETGFALGGEAGARQCAAWGIGVSPDTLLALLRRHAPARGAVPRVLGVDDWSFRRGQRMGTILVDLEQHRPVDLLSDSTEEAFTAWLQAHPGVEIISRDRGEAYARGGKAGAPNAIHVAGRWHLLKNLSDAVQKLLARHPATLRQAARALTPHEIHTDPPAASQLPPSPKRRPRAPQPSPVSHQRRRQLAMYQQVRELAAQGWSVAALARHLKLTKTTVRKYRDMEMFRDQRTTARPSAVEPYRAYIEQRWAEGCTEVNQLWLEVQAQGYRGSYKSVWMFTRGWQPPLIPAAPAPPAAPTTPVWTPRQAMWLLTREPDTLDGEEQTYRERLCELCPDAATAYSLVQAFQTMLRERRVEQLASWLAQARACGVRELRRFALGLRQDDAAVRAAFVYPWSQGQTEGQVNRLKQIKRQMYGRAKFDLLRLRVLHRSGP
ncbi:MAG TPA: ISL3 family transposase [Roseiflexaceae bacterium]|nr:ISL3 family transposase [Roseiflexaceae bacterium]